MALDVKFLKGTAAQYEASAKTVTTFYFVDETDLYLGNVKLSNATDLANAVARISTNETDIASIQDQLKSLVGSESGSISDMIDSAINDLKDELQPQITANKNAIDAINNADTGILATAKKYADTQDTTLVGSLDDLTTTAKTNVIDAINELSSEISGVGTAGEVKLTENPSTETYSKSYTLTQGTTTVGTIDIPKDMVVESGTVETNPEGQPEGTYIVLTLANATNDKIYVNVGTLVDIYKAKESAAQVQIAIDSSTREISATIVAGSVTSTELAANAVTTEKIADANVTKAKLATSLQSAIESAESALQAADITTGSANGTIAVDGTDVAVKGLGSAAYKESSAFDAAGSASTAESNAEAYTDSALTWNTIS